MRIKKGTSLMHRTAGEVKRYRQYKRIIPICLGCISLLTVLVYVVSLLYTRFGSFTISVNKYHNLNYGLSLSEDPNFAKGTSKLTCKASQDLTNIDGKTLDDKNLGAYDGEANGTNYICYTFYCKNVESETVDYEYSINIVNMTQNIQDAVRVRLIKSKNNGKTNSVDYASPKGVDEYGKPIPETEPYETTPFYQTKIVTLQKETEFIRGDIMKYTVVIWLEGNDDDCIDDIIGGSFKIDMRFSVVKVNGSDVY